LNVLLAAKRKVEAEEAETYAKENGLFFMETSAKTVQNVNELFYGNHSVAEENVQKVLLQTTWRCYRKMK
jgi:hypothetical protein